MEVHGTLTLAVSYVEMESIMENTNETTAIISMEMVVMKIV